MKTILGADGAVYAHSGDTLVVFQLTISEMSGREERLYWELLPLSGEQTEGVTRGSADAWLTHSRALELRELSSVLPDRRRVGRG